MAKVAPHPLVHAFLHTSAPMAVIVDEQPQPHDEITRTLRNIFAVFKGKRADTEVLRALQHFPLEAVDPDLRVIFFVYWCYLLSRAGRMAECTALHRHGGLCIGSRTPPEISAFHKMFDAELAAIGGDNNRAEGLMRELLTACPNSPRRPNFVVLPLTFFAHQGRAADFEKELNWLVEGKRKAEWQARAALVRFIDAVESGRARDAERLRPVLDSDPDTNLGYRERLSLLDMMLRPLPDTAADSPREGEWPAHVSTRCLLRQRPDQALQEARRHSAAHPGHFYASNILGYALIRAELACGQGEAARRLIDARRTRGTRHYFDEFFLARAEMLAGNTARAREHFASLAAPIARYKAEGRLEFELRLACELTPAGLFALMRNGESTAGAARVHTSKAAPPPASPTEHVEQDALVGGSAALLAIRESLRRLGPLNAPVLITGETGTGKELAARGLHAASPRRGDPFVAVNCGAIADSLLESELFGHARGAFTGAVQTHRGVFEEAGKGTLFLDEIGEISPRLQTALLRTLESDEIRPVGSERTRKIQCRLIMATNVNLDDAVRNKAFRQDLLYRMRRLELHLPPLRERKDDILPLARHFLNLGRRDGGVSLTPELERALLEYEWPGNIRELKNQMERMRLLNSDRLHYGLESFNVNPSQPPELPRAVKAANFKPDSGAQTGGDITELLRAGASRMRRQDRIRQLFLQHKKLTLNELVRILGVSYPTASLDLKMLRAENFIRKIEPSASPRSHYFALSDNAD